ncbi:MAG TPA: TadE/TadG family type IV pilus assembly protein [Gemmataceae bacterium]|jgi:Flp pilus assembly protein TadG
MTRRTIPPRRGASAVEAAVVLPVLFLFVFGLIVGGLGAFRYQEVAMLAREGSRWAAVHGTTYQDESGRQTPVTAADVYNNAMKPLAVALDPAKISYTVRYTPDNQPPASTVSVTVTYRWLPEVYLVGPITLSCTSTRVMAY